MTKSGFSFDSAPNSSGGFRGVSRQIALVLGGNKLLGNKRSGSEGLSHAERADLMGRQHEYNVREKVVGHAVGEMSAEAAHKRGQRAERAKNKRSESAAEAAHTRSKDAATHNFDTLTNAATNPKFGSINLKTGSATFTKPEESKPATALTTSPQFNKLSKAVDLTGM